MINEEGGVDPEQFRMEAMFDRMDAIGKAMLGLTIQCSQCHNHKYDPITQEDYYRIFAYLNNDSEAQPRVYAPDEWMRRANVLRQIGEVEAKLQHETPDWRERMAKWEDEWRAKPKAEWHVFQPEVDKNTTGGQRYLPQPDREHSGLGISADEEHLQRLVEDRRERNHRLPAGDAARCEPAGKWPRAFA